MSDVPNAPTVQEDLSQLTDEEKRKILKPDPSKEDVHQILVTQFVTAGQSVQVCNRLESYDDCNYLVTLDGTKYILKVHNGVESDAYQKDPNQCRIALLRSIFRHLQEHSSQVQSSQIVSPQDGHSGIAELNVVVQVHSPRKLAVTLLSYVEGTPMCNVNGMGLETLVGAGQYLGHVCHSMDNCPQDMKDLGQSLYHAWDGKNTADILPPFLQYITCSDRRQLVQSVLDAFSSNLSHFQSTFRKGLLQADFNDANILLQPNKDHGWKVSGVIDFGDSTYSWRVLDVSVAMSYAMMTTYGKAHRSLSAAAAMLRQRQNRH